MEKARLCFITGGVRSGKAASQKEKHWSLRSKRMGTCITLPAAVSVTLRWVNASLGTGKIGKAARLRGRPPNTQRILQE